MTISFYKISLISLVAIITACGEEHKPSKNLDWSNEKSSELNKQFAAEAELDINLFLARKKDWKITKTGTGLRYYIYEQGAGKPPVAGDVVDAEYVISLLDGTVCYKTNPDEVIEFKVDNSQVETGIQEAIKLMREGGKAKLIIPSHIAHGLIGDMTKIPPLSTLLVDIKLVKIYRKHEQTH